MHWNSILGLSEVFWKKPFLTAPEFHQMVKLMMNIALFRSWKCLNIAFMILLTMMWLHHQKPTN
jgi:hypothetical protein